MSSTVAATKNELNTRQIGPVIISFSGVKLTDKECLLLANPKVGGVVLFRENWDKTNVDPKAALKKFIASCRAINKNLIFMVDHEGGKIWRFEQGFTKIPSAKTMGHKYDTDKAEGLKFAYEQGKIMASELLACGIDRSLAPVLDLDGPSNVIGKLERGFHKDPVVTAKLTEAFIRGMNAAGMQATAKHFPGHGTCLADSHVETPVDKREIEELLSDLLPFQANILKCNLGAVMPAHVLYPAVDPNFPAGFSPVWIQGYLRKWGFDGVVMSDCLSMAGAKVDSGNALDKLLAAQKAGCDFLMLTHQHNHIDPQKPQLLDDLLAVINKVPDSTESARRRAQFAINMTSVNVEDSKSNAEFQKKAAEALVKAAAATEQTAAGIQTTVAPPSSNTLIVSMHNIQSNSMQVPSSDDEPPRSVLNKD